MILGIVYFSLKLIFIKGTSLDVNFKGENLDSVILSHFYYTITVYLFNLFIFRLVFHIVLLERFSLRVTRSNDSVVNKFESN